MPPKTAKQKKIRCEGREKSQFGSDATTNKENDEMINTNINIPLESNTNINIPLESNNIQHHLSDYNIVNLSERRLGDPINQNLSFEEKGSLKEIWLNLEPDRQKSIKYNKWETKLQLLVNKYQKHLNTEDIFDYINLEDAIDEVMNKPYDGKLDFQEHYDNIWIQDVYKRFFIMIKSPVNQLLDPEQCEISYREAIVNPIIAKSFDDVNNIVKFNTGEIEAKTQKTQKNETIKKMVRVCVGCHHDGIIQVNVNACEMEIAFMEVVGSAIYFDTTKFNDDLNKVLNSMYASIYYQKLYHMGRGATEDQVKCIESFGIVVYQRCFKFYVMHHNDGFYIVDKFMEFNIPNSVGQLYVLKEVVMKAYLFKSRIMDYSIKIQKITHNSITTKNIHTLPFGVLPSKRKGKKQTELQSPS